MNKIVFGIIAFLMLNFIAVEATQASLEIRSAIFRHSSDRFRGIYGNVSGDYALEATTRLTHHFEAWANFGWLSRDGKSIGFGDPTSVNIGNVSFGIKYPFRVSSKFIPYLGVGPGFSRITLKNRSQCRNESLSDWAVGCVVKSGIYYFISKNLFFDLFADYLYQPVQYETRVDIGGVKVGAGVGVKF